MTKDFPWFSKYPAGIPHEIGPLEYQSLVELFEVSSKKFKDRIAFENMGEQLSFNEINRLSTSFAAFLQKELGLKKGDRIAIQMPNLLQFPIAFIGALKAGLIVVNTNPLYTPREMEHQFKDAGILAIVILDNFAANLQAILEKIPAKHIIITRIGDMMGPVKGAITNFVVKSFDVQGQLISEVTGQKARHFPDTDVLEIDAARVRSSKNLRITTGKGDRAYSNGDGSEVQLVGNAVVVREAGKDAKGQQLPRAEYRGEFLHAFMRTDEIKSHKPVIVTRGADQFTGDNMAYNNVDGIMQLDGRVRVRLESKAP